MNKRSVTGFASYLLPAILYSLLIFLISAMSNPPAPSFDLEWGDKINHAGAFGLMMLLAFRGLRWLYPDRRAGALALAGLLYCVLYGLTDEIHQSFVPNRQCDIFDLLADATGASLGVLFILATHRSGLGRLLFGPSGDTAPPLRVS